MAQSHQINVFCNFPYDPFGMIIVGRSWDDGSEYRYGFNGKENTDEISGDDNSVDFGARLYDCRLGRWMSVDALTRKYPGWNPYTHALDNPIYFLDPDGNDGIASIQKAATITIKGKTHEGGTLKNPHTLTITANYYYNAIALHYPEAEGVLKEVISAYNNSSFVIQGEDGNYYKVAFNLSAIPVEEQNWEDIRNNHSMHDFKGDGTKEYLPFGNIISANIPGMEPDFNDPEHKSDLAETDFQKTSLLTSQIDALIVDKGFSLKDGLFNILMHEIGHNLGGAHTDEGVMITVKTVTEPIQVKVDGRGDDLKYIQRTKLISSNIKGFLSTMFNPGTGRSGGRPGEINEYKE